MDHIFGHVDLIPECKKTWGRRDEEKWKMASCDCSKIAEKGRKICPAVMKHCGKHGWGVSCFREDGMKQRLGEVSDWEYRRPIRFSYQQRIEAL
jgi:hypothetical protein